MNALNDLHSEADLRLSFTVQGHLVQRLPNQFDFLCLMATEVSRDTVIQWCLKNAFELVELSSPVTDSDGNDDGLLLSQFLLP